MKLLAPLKYWHNKGLIPVKIKDKWGFVDGNKNYFAKCEYTKFLKGIFVGLPSGYKMKKNGQTVLILIDKNGDGYIK